MAQAIKVFNKSKFIGYYNGTKSFNPLTLKGLFAKKPSFFSPEFIAILEDALKKDIQDFPDKDNIKYLLINL